MVDTFKNTLMQALHVAAGYANDGSTPSQAVAKAANDMGFNVDQAQRLTETFNTARTIFHYKTASDRTAMFPLADKDEVLGLLFATPATKAAASTSYFDYSCYEHRERDYRGDTVLAEDGSHAVKAASVAEFNDTTLDTQCSKAMTIIGIHRDLAETARHEAQVYATRAGTTLSKLAADLGRGYIEDCRNRYSRLLAACKDMPVISKLAEYIPALLRVEPASGVVEDRDLGIYIDTLKQAQDDMVVESEMLAVSDQLNKEASAFERDFMELVLPALPQKKAEALGDLVSPDFFNSLKHAAAPAVNGPSKSKPGTGILDKLITDPVAKVTSGIAPTLEQALTAPQAAANKSLSERLKNVQRQVMLEELLTTDQVLSEEDPQKVINAYQSVMQVAPDLSMNKEVMRSVLRSAVQSVAISPYDAGNWAQVEKTLRQITGKMPASDARADKMEMQR